MRNTGLILWSSILSLLLFTTSCERSEGEGGKASIEGFIYKIVDDGIVVKKDTVYTIGDRIVDTTLYFFQRDTIIAAEEDVYIIYGGDSDAFFGDRTRTSYNGKYKFEYLVEGNYSVYAYDNMPNKVKTAEIQSLKIGKKGSHKVPDIYVKDGKNAGLSGIVGKVRVIYDNTTNPKGTPRMDMRVYIKLDGTEAPVDDARTDENGYFVFTKLTPGKYKIWVATEEIKDQLEPEWIYVDVPKTSNADGTGQIINIEDPIIVRITYEKK